MSRLVALAAVLSLLSGCLGGEDVEPSTLPPDDEPAEPPANATEGTLVERLAFDGVLALSVGTPLVAANPGSSTEEFLFTFDVPADAESAVVALVWNATQTTSERLTLLVEDPADGSNVESADGPSPLFVALDVGAVAGKTLQTRTFASATGGLAKDQPFAVLVEFVRAGVAAE